MLEISVYSDSKKIYDSSIRKEIEVKYNKMGRKMYSITPLGLAFLNLDALGKGNLQLDFSIFKEVLPLSNNMYLIFIALVIGGAIVSTLYCSTKKEKEADLNTLIKNILYILMALSPSLLFFI